MNLTLTITDPSAELVEILERIARIPGAEVTRTTERTPSLGDTFWAKHDLRWDGDIPA